MKTLGIAYPRNKVKIYIKLKTNFTSFHFTLGRLAFANKTSLGQKLGLIHHIEMEWKVKHGLSFCFGAVIATSST